MINILSIQDIKPLLTRLIGFIFLSMVFYLLIFFPPYPPQKIVFILWFFFSLLLTFSSTRWGMNFLFILLPLCINQVGTKQAFFLDLYFLVLVIAMVTDRKGLFKKPKTFYNQLFVIIIGTIVFITTLSFLYSFPLVRLAWQSCPNHGRLFSLFLLMTSNNVLYPIPEFFFFLLLVLYIFSFLSKVSSNNSKQEVIKFLLMGMTLSVFISVLNFMGLIDLNWLRAENEFTHLVLFGRFQSMAGHPAWFAEYTLVLLPFFLFSSPYYSKTLNLWIKSIGLFLILLVIMTFQIGAWISLCFLLLFILLRNYSLLTKKLGQLTLKSYFIFGILLLFLLELFIRWQEHLLTYNDEVLTLLFAKFHHRFYLWKSSFKFWQSHPFIGWGKGVFSSTYSALIPNWHPEFVQFHTTAHSTFFQILFETGLIGLILFITLLFIVILHNNSSKDGKPISGIHSNQRIFASLFVFIVYGLFQYMFFTKSVSILFFTIVCLSFGEDDNLSKEKISIKTRNFIMLIFFFIIALSTVAFVIQYSKDDKPEIGLYELEHDAKGNLFCWTEKDINLNIPAKNDGVELVYSVLNPDIKKKPVTVQIFIDNKLIEYQRFKKAGSRVFRYDKPLKGMQKLRIRVNRVWCPYCCNNSSDFRLLGIRIDYLSFYHGTTYWDIYREDIQRFQTLRK